MKEKNTFSKLRRTNKALINKLNGANKIVCLQIEEIDRLNKTIDIKDIFIGSLEIKEKELSDKIYSLYDKLEEQNKLNTDNYNAWLEEHETNRKLSIGLTVMTVGWIVPIVLAIGVLLK